MRKILLLIAISCLLQRIQAQPILPEREQSRVVDELLEERFNTVLPQLMQRTNIDLWLVISREYNEDPILKTMLPSTWLSARRTTMLAFYFNPISKQVEKFAIARYNVGKSIPAAWDMTKFPEQWDALIDLIKKKDPKKIGLPVINMSSSYIFAKNDYFLAYVNNYNHYVSYYRNTYQHGGISMEEMIVPFLVFNAK